MGLFRFFLKSPILVLFVSLNESKHQICLFDEFGGFVLMLLKNPILVLFLLDFASGGCGFFLLLRVKIGDCLFIYLF